MLPVGTPVRSLAGASLAGASLDGTGLDGASLGTGFDGSRPAAKLGRLAPMPSARGLLDGLYEAVGAYTGSGATSPLTAAIVRTVVAMTAARLIEYPVADGRAEVARLSLASTPALPVDGQMCAVVAVDIAGFTRPDRDDDIRRYLHEKLYEYLEKAFDQSRIPWAECFWEDRGDGALIVLQPEIPVKGIIDPLPEKLRSLIRRHNHVSCAAAAMQLRVAAHIGPVDHDGHGFVGTDVNFAFRMLEARPLKAQLAESGTELGLIVSDYVYSSLICRYPVLVDPRAFRTVRFQTKSTRARAWTYLPGAAS